jgi:hypothetical protein
LWRNGTTAFSSSLQAAIGKSGREVIGGSYL